MILDARAQDVSLDWAVPIAIIGAGPAGMILARELAEVMEVLILESGGFESDARQQALLEGECAGIDYPLTETRARQFGGSSALWAGYCALFDPHDFEQRDWVPMSGWPFGIESIQPYFARTAETLGLGEFNFDASDISRRTSIALPFENGAVAPTVWRFGTPTRRFGESLRSEFEASSKITTLLYANVVDIRVDSEHNTVTELKIRTLDGREGRVSAGLFILACGGIETPRILLNADSQIPGGLANSSGMVGRCFMEHPHRTITPLAIQNLDALKGWSARAVYDGDKEFMFCVGLSAQAQQQASVLNARAHVFRTPAMQPGEKPKVGLFMEQAPNPDSRVLLSDETDALGMRKARLDWRLNDLDWKTYERTASALAAEFDRKGIGRLSAPIDLSAREREPVLHSNHHLGTTRISARREEGVVGPNCRVHDLSNLYIMGGSIFPTVSWANPTFTLIALTYRLADHLRQELSPPLRN